MGRREIARAGAIAGSITIFFALVGLTDRFAKLYLVGRGASFGRLILFIAPIVAAMVVASARRPGEPEERPAIRDAAMRGAAVGLIAGAVFAAFVLAVDAIGVERVRGVFINVSPAMMVFVTFGLGAGGGAVVLTLGSALVGGLAGAYRALRDPVRKPIGSALLAVFVLGFLQRIVPISLDQLHVERDWLYSKVTGGLTYAGAALIAAAAAGLSILKARKGAEIRAYFATPGPGDEGAEPVRWTGPRVALLVVAVGAALAIPQVVGSVVADALGFVLIFALLGLGLNIVVGYAGLLDLGYVFFFAVGAYAMALLTGATLNTFTGSARPVFGLDLNFWIAIVIVAAIAAGAGLLIGAPVLRLRGDYLALVTLGLGEMATVLLKSPWLEPVVGGPNGMRGVTDAAVLGVGFRDPKNFYYLGLLFVAFAAFVSWRLAASRVGRAWTAMREDEQIADAMGVSTTRFKLLAFAMGGAIGSLGGALFAVKIGSLTPASFEVLVSIQVLGIVILGGMGSVPGVIVGALVLVGLPQLLREFEEYRLLAYGAAIVLIMVLHPQGLVPNVRRSRELLDTDRAQDKWAGDLAADEHVAPEITPLGEGAG